MKRLALVAFVIGSAFGCQQAALSPPAKLLGLNDMVRVGQYLVVPSTERDELRLLNMVTPTQGVRAFVGAPNPLQPLAITVLQRPTTLAVDLDYQDYKAYSVAGQPTIPLGTEVTGPFVYASSPGTNEISIVNIGIGAPSPDGGITTAASSTEQFIELKRLLTAGPVTAMAASTMDSGHTLYFATDDGTQATLWQTPMTSPADMLGMSQDALEVSQASVFTLPQGETVHSMLALPGNRLAIATRSNGGKDGRAFIYSLGDGGVLPLAFPQPVRRLYTHAGYVDFTDAGTPPTPPGSRIFGILDEEFCGSWQCGGILAVEAFDGGIAWDLAGKVSTLATTEQQKQMLPMRFGTANVVGLALQPAGAMVLPPVALPLTPVATETALSLLGVATLSTGGIVFFNAKDLTVYDTEDGITQFVIDPAVVGVSLKDATGNPLDVTVVPGGPDVDGGVIGMSVALPTFTNGKQVDETLTVVFEGAIPGLIGLNADGGFLSVGAGAETRAAPNDLVVSCINPVDGGLFNDDGGFITAGFVTSIASGGISFAPTGECPPDPSAAYSVRAGAGFQPFVVTGSTSGYMGRVDAGDDLVYQGVYTRHPDEIQQLDFNPDAAQMVLPFYPGIAGIAPGDFWTLAVDDNYNPTLATMDPTAANCGLPVNILGPVVVNPDIEDYFFAVPSAAAIVDLNAASAARGPIESNMSCWR
jgi:hypothetical protein